MTEISTLESIQIIFKGALTGVLIVFLLLYGLRPAIMYPDSILEIIDNPWVFLVLLIINYYIFLWDDTIGLLFLLTLIAMMIDILLFTEGGIKIHDPNLEVFANNLTESCTRFIDNNAIAFKDIQNILFDPLQQYKQNENNVSSSFLQSNKRPCPFI
jgi:hypothetical protein